MTTHRLKLVNPWFALAWKGEKPFELRLNDRNFQVGDTIELFEFDRSQPDILSGTREIHGTITTVLESYTGLNPGYCIFSYHVLRKSDAIQAKT